MEFHFSKAHGTGPGARITALCLDGTGRRLLTGSHSGEVKVWNYSCGSCLKVKGRVSASLPPSLPLSLATCMCVYVA